MNYTHLTQDERYQIAILAKAGHGQSDIAKLMNRHKSTIGRELKRNLGKRGYRPKQAHEFSQARLRACENGSRIAMTRGLLSRPSSPKPGARSRSPVTSRPTTSRLSATKASISVFTPTSERVAPCTIPCAVKRLAENAMVADASDAAPFQIKCRLSCDRRWSMHENALATGKATWSSARVSSRRL